MSVLERRYTPDEMGKVYCIGQNLGAYFMARLLETLDESFNGDDEPFDRLCIVFEQLDLHGSAKLAEELRETER